MDTRPFDENKLVQLQKEEAFDFYHLHDESSWWDRLTGFIDRLLTSFSQFLSENINIQIPPIVFEILMYGLMVGGIVFLVMKLLGVELKTILPYGQKKVAITPYEIDQEDINQMDFEDLIAQAKHANQYELVIRYYYLYLLRMLSDAEIINYETRKTNREYVNELQRNTSQYKDDFATVARVFERIWYGKIPASLENCQVIESSVVAVKSGLK